MRFIQYKSHKVRFEVSLRWAATEHTGESEVQLSVGTRIDAYGIKQQRQVTFFLQVMGGTTQDTLRSPTYWYSW